jgi:hypothetical protein
MTSSSNPGCGSTLSGYYTGTGLHVYPAVTLGVSTLPYGACIEAHCQSIIVPNNFKLNTKTTGWIGQANYSGPWGNSLNTVSDSSLYILKGTGTNTVNVQTYTNSNTDNYSVDILCHQRNPVLTSLNSTSVTQTMLNAFNTLPLNYTTLENTIGLGRALTANDIDFVNLATVYDANSPDTNRAVCAPFKSNSSSSSSNFVFSMIRNGGVYTSPMIVKTSTNHNASFYRLYANGDITTINKYDSVNYTVIATSSTYMNTGGSPVVLRCSGNDVAYCKDHLYTKRGWVSVWTQLATVIAPEVIQLR